MSIEYSVYRVQPVFDKFPVPGGMDNVDLEQLYFYGNLQKYEQDGLSKTLWTDGNYTALIYPKAVPSLPYEALITIVPNTGKVPVVSTMDQLSTASLLGVLDASDKSRQAAIEVAQEDGHRADMSYIIQHVGPYDTKPKASYNTSYLPLHLHSQVYGPDMSGFPVFRRVEPINLKKHHYRNLARDQFALVARDLIEINGFRPTLRQKSTIELGTSHINDPFTSQDAGVLQAIMYLWKEKRLELELCGKSNQEDCWGRPIPLPIDERKLRLEELLTKADWHEISRQSKRILRLLFNNLQEASEDSCDWIYKGIFGSIGYEYDPETKQRTLLFAPQNLTNPFRNYRVVRRPIITKKDKTNGNIDRETADVILPIQRRIIDRI
ncbi:MAG: hypothetical protein Q8P72_01100 [Candidatus Roizmanbacteria bacterium]|nr:hypothetical protein [Candidatus Roizmanbacteria bacterium]